MHVMHLCMHMVFVRHIYPGRCNRRFSHDQEALEVCEVLFAWDEKRDGDVVYAAGWNAKVRHAQGEQSTCTH